MAKTIKDMTYKSLLNENVNSTESDYSRGLLEGYKKGANAVLQEIESIITSNEDNTLCMARCLVDKIRELKREE